MPTLEAEVIPPRGPRIDILAVDLKGGGAEEARAVGILLSLDPPQDDTIGDAGLFENARTVPGIRTRVAT